MTKINKKVGFLGAGKMAEALILGMVERNILAHDNIFCFDVNPERLAYIESKLNVRTVQDNRLILRECDIIFLAFKPQNFPDALEGLTELVRPEQIVISIMAGIRMNQIQPVIPGKIIRVMPNTPCLIGEMAAGFAADDDVADEDLQTVQALLAGAGTAHPVDESDLDAVTGLSGSGPAFVAYLIQSFIEAAVCEGLQEDVARALALKTFSGTANLLRDWNMSPRELIQMVSSPHGTTVAGRDVLEASDVADVIQKTVSRAAQRSRELAM